MSTEESVVKELQELKTKVVLLEDRLTQLDEHPTYEKTQNMIHQSLTSVPDKDNIIVIIQDTLKKQNVVNEELVDKKLAKLKLWVYATFAGVVGVILNIIF